MLCVLRQAQEEDVLICTSSYGRKIFLMLSLSKHAVWSPRSVTHVPKFFQRQCRAEKGGIFVQDQAGGDGFYVIT